VQHGIVTGIVFQRSEVRPSDITDGMSCTIFAGEKFLPTNHYTDGRDAGDNESMYAGFDDDSCRNASSAYPPVEDYAVGDEVVESPNHTGFGSAHGSGCNFVFCDGSVHTISYTIDPTTYDCLGSRRDGNPIGANAY
jgi:prepilin-type processing-associated H-X9-DG protein